jgi:hypothetical protein
MIVRHTYYYNSIAFGDSVEDKGSKEMTIGDWDELSRYTLTDILNGVEIFISLQDNYPTVEVVVGDNAHLYQVIEM